MNYLIQPKKPHIRQLLKLKNWKKQLKRNWSPQKRKVKIRIDNSFLRFRLYCCFSLGEEKVEETKQWLGEKKTEALAKGSEILGATHHALASGAAAVTEKAKHGLEIASEAASTVKAATGQLAADATAKVAETAHTAHGKTIFIYLSSYSSLNVSIFKF